MFGVSIPFKVAVSRKFKAFGWGWFCESTVPVGQAVPNKPVVRDPFSSVFSARLGSSSMLSLGA